MNNSDGSSYKLDGGHLPFFCIYFYKSLSNLMANDHGGYRKILLIKPVRKLKFISLSYRLTKNVIDYNKKY